MTLKIYVYVYHQNSPQATTCIRQSNIILVVFDSEDRHGGSLPSRSLSMSRYAFSLNFSIKNKFSDSVSFRSCSRLVSEKDALRA